MSLYFYLPLFLLFLWAYICAVALFSSFRAWVIRKLNPPKVSKGTYLPPHTYEAEAYAEKLRFLR